VPFAVTGEIIEMAAFQRGVSLKQMIIPGKCHGKKTGDNKII
jgi:hypothetical protein